MDGRIAQSILVSGVQLVALLSALPVQAADERPTHVTEAGPDFKKAIAPILLRRCVSCHGAARQEAGLRLDRRADALKGNESGPVIAPGNSHESRLFQRVIAESADVRMPADSGPLSAEEVATLRGWIDAGAVWPLVDATIAESSQHWAYIAPRRPTVPDPDGSERIKQAVDAFILARLTDAGRTLSAQATKERLIRRVTIDLTGLPPALDEIDDFLADSDPNAYEKLVDRLLASPAYGERWATPWLDAARYADSNGFQRDGPRSSWAYRDWVVHAMNADMPFDQFTIEQIAGDLLPDATFEQQVATGFHRGAMTNLENGIDVQEQRVVAVLDRVNTTAAVWLGTTLECAQCHDHKYDPFSQQDYYRLFAFFNNTEREIKPGFGGYFPELIGPALRLYPLLRPEDQSLGRELETTIALLQEEISRLRAELAERQPAWEESIRSGKTTVPESIKQIVEIPVERRETHHVVALYRFFQSTFRRLAPATQKLNAARRQLEDVVPTSLVMRELPEPRETHVFNRGDFLDLGELVQAGTPSALHPLPPERNANRLTLARWLVDEANPLVARVTVNRHWREFFGRGLVATIDDFGTQGDRPTHPELLDWLATEFVRQSWSVKALHRLIVTSATYRQAATVTAEHQQEDPENSLYGRGPRRRLSAEMIRDHALATSGLLSQAMHGPPVFPVQPKGIWRQVDAKSNQWRTSSGDDRYRRGLYVYWKRTSPYPSFVNFDAPSREVCVLGRNESITPLQALNLLNDPVHVEAASGLAARILCELPATTSRSTRAAYGFRLVTSRRPSHKEAAVLNKLVGDLVRVFGGDDADAYRIPAATAKPPETSTVEWTAWVQFSRMLLNLDEATTKS